MSGSEITRESTNATLTLCEPQRTSASCRYGQHGRFDFGVEELLSMSLVIQMYFGGHTWTM
eukprot:6490364-Amphidinium_carterae.2